jgi:hypothetical protein
MHDSDIEDLYHRSLLQETRLRVIEIHREAEEPLKAALMRRIDRLERMLLILSRLVIRNLPGVKGEEFWAEVYRDER